MIKPILQLILLTLLISGCNNNADFKSLKLGDSLYLKTLNGAYNGPLYLYKKGFIDENKMSKTEVIQRKHSESKIESDSLMFQCDYLTSDQFYNNNTSFIGTFEGIDSTPTNKKQKPWIKVRLNKKLKPSIYPIIGFDKYSIMPSYYISYKELNKKNVDSLFK